MNTNVFIMLVGLPGSGKSSYAKEILRHADRKTEHLSSDNIREEVFGDVNRQDKNKEVFEIMKQRTEDSLKKGSNVIYDAINVVRKRRVALLKSLKEQFKKTIFMTIVICPTYEEVLRRNSKRERVVPEAVIKKMLLNFECPIVEEGWDLIDFEGQFEDPASVGYKDLCMNVILDYMDYDQNNPYHTLSLGEHIKRTLEIYRGCEVGGACQLEDLIDLGSPIALALNFHDIGKPYARVEGEDGYSHYYGHEHASSYIFLSYFYRHLDVQLVCHLIECHMLAHKLTPKNARRRYIEEGSREWTILKIMAYCDSNAK